MIRISPFQRHRLRQLFAVLSLLAAPVAAAEAQGVLARAVRRLAAASADMALSRAETIDLSAAGLAPVPFGPVLAGVSGVDVAPGSAIRVRLFLYNGADTAVTLPAVPDTAFVLVDGTGTRFPFVSARVRATLNGAQFTIPALERAAIDLVFALSKASAAEAVLKLGPGTVIRGIPTRQPAAVPPAPAPPDTTPADTTRPPVVPPS